MNEENNSFLSVVEPYRVVLLDAFGVFWGGGAVGLYPGALRTFEVLKSQGKIVGILSNSTMLSEQEKNKYALAGLLEGKHYDFLMTSGQMLHDELIKEENVFPAFTDNKYWVFGDTQLVSGVLAHHLIFEHTSFEETADISKAGFIYIDVPRIAGEDQENVLSFDERVKECLHSGLPMVCANPDVFACEGNPARPVIRQGGIAELYENYGGKVYYFGKPHKLIFETALSVIASRYGTVDRKQIVMVGDNPGTDIRGGNAVDITTVLISGTGIISEKFRNVPKERFLEALPGTDRPKEVISVFSCDTRPLATHHNLFCVRPSLMAAHHATFFRGALPSANNVCERAFLPLSKKPLSS